MIEKQNKDTIVSGGTGSIKDLEDALNKEKVRIESESRFKLDKNLADEVNSIVKSGVKLFAKGKLEKAAGQFKNALTIDPDNPDCLYYLGLYAGKREDYRKGIDYLEQILHHEYSYLHVKQIYLCLGFYHSELGENQKAIEYFEKALALDFNLTNAMAALGHIYSVGNQLDKSLKILESGLKIDPENPSLLNTLGYILADRDIDTARGLDLCLRAREKNPKSGAYCDSLGWAYYKNDNRIRGKQMLLEAERLLPDNEIIKEHLRIVNSDS
ncbi:MAG: tetratricopeptide repeat protein [Actinomycetia bacterium]|nr:tetratricopeptide repeat protein [Actinomycetes bacterium]